VANWRPTKRPIVCCVNRRLSADNGAGMNSLSRPPSRTVHRVGWTWKRPDAMRPDLGGRCPAGARRHATAYEPRLPVESFLETGVAGNVFRRLPRATFHVRAYNDRGEQQTVRGKLAVTDFFESRSGGQGRRAHGALPFGREHDRGRRWPGPARFLTGPSGRRAAQPVVCGVRSSSPSARTPWTRAGFNHAFPGTSWCGWHASGRHVVARLVAKWNTVEPEQGRFDFSCAGRADPAWFAVGQPSRSPSAVSLHVLVHDGAPRGHFRANDRYLRSRCRWPTRPRTWRTSPSMLRRCAALSPGKASQRDALSDPERAVYTSYALPRQFGYTLADYCGCWRRPPGHESGGPAVLVVGGISPTPARA